MAKTPTPRGTQHSATKTAKKTETKAAAAPTKRSYVRYTKKTVGKICRRLALGEAWTRISRENDMPCHETFYDWMRDHPDFAARVAEARRMAADTAVDDMMEVARGVTASNASAARVQIGTYQWTAARNAPGRYGSKVEAQGGPPRIVEIRVRQFERAVGPDGVAYLRELKPLTGAS